MTTPTVHRYHTTEHLSRAHADEFIVVIDSLGRRWNPLLHPRDKNGRFIRTFSFVTFEMPDGSVVSGRVAGIDRDGNLLVKVSGVGKGGDPRVDTNGYVKVPHDKVEVQTIKAQLSGKGAAGVLQKQQNDSVTTSINSLKQMGMSAESTKLAEAQRLAMEAPDPRDPKSVANKDKAIDLFREVAEAVDEERGKGFKEGDDYEEIKANLPTDERTRLQNLDAVIKNTYTARHSLGDKTVEGIETSQGTMKGNQPQVRIEAAENELVKDYANDAKVWDITSGELVEGQLEQPQKATVRDTVAEPQTEGLPEFWRSAYARLRSGVDRLTGSQQALQVAPGDRHHVDKTGENVVRVGHIAHFDKTKSRGEFTGMVTRIYTDTKQKKWIYGRDFDPDGSKGYQDRYGTPYHDWAVTSKSIELASEDQQSELFQRLALQGQDEASKSLVQSFTDEYITAMQRRYATPGALKISATGGGFFDVVPIHLRQKDDANGEKLRIGDAVRGPLGEDGYVSYLEPNSPTVKVYYRNGETSRLTSKRLTRWHGPTAEVYPGESGPGSNNYIPTRDEAADIADEKGAASVAQVIRDGGDAHAIQAAMVTDVEFQSKVDDVDALYNKRDQTLSAGQELSDEDRTELDKWDRMLMASAGYFREPNPDPPEPPEAPVAEDDEAPQNPDNPTEKVTSGGTTIRSEGTDVIVGDNTEDPIDAGDQEAIDQAVEDAEGAQQPEPEAPTETAPQALADRLVSDLGRLVEEAKNAPHVDNSQRAQLTQLHTRLADAVKAKDGPGMVRSLQGLTTMINRQVNGNLHQTRLRGVLNGKATGGVPMADFFQQKLDAGEDIFGAPTPVVRPDRPEGQPDESPEGVDPKVDQADNMISEALTLDDGSTMVMVGDDIADDGFYVMDPATVVEYDNEPTTKDITDFLNETEGSDYDGVSVWYDEADGRYRMARVSVFDNEQDASDAAVNSDTNQYVNIADGAVMNIALGTDPNLPSEAVEDPRSEERAVRTAGTGKAAAKSTSKQKKMLDHVAQTGGDEELGRIATAIKNGEEISGADASRLADAIDAMDAGQFDKPADKGVASQLAHRLARAAGEEGARGYSSQNTALRRTSDVGISLSAQSQDDAIRTLTTDARDDIKNGDNAAAAEKFRAAADAFDALGLGNDVPSRRAREHADRLEAMGGVTGPAPEGVVAPEAPEQAPGQGVGTAREALDAAGMPEVQPLTKSGFSNPDTPRTREVSPEEYASLSLKGRDTLDGLLDNSTAPDALQGQTWDEIKTQAYDAVQEEWGGITVDAHTGQAVTGDEDAYAITFRRPGTETVSVPIGASQEEFDAAMEQALQQFGGEQDSPLWAEKAHLGVFRNEDTGNYEMDPVLVFEDLADAEAVGAYSGSNGGAYNFKDGLGYWPPHVAEEAAGGTGPEEGVPGTRGLEVPGEPGGEAEPGLPAEEQAPGPAGGGTEAEVLAEVNSALGSVDHAIDSEREAPMESGRPGGWSDAIDEANAQLGLIRGKVTDEGPYTQLSKDLRDLADHIEDSFTLSDPSGVVAELRATADTLDGGPEKAAEVPEGGTPGEEGGGGAPFRLDLSDPGSIRDVLTSEEFQSKRSDAVSAYFEELHKISDALMKDVDKDSVVGRLLNDRIVDAESKFSDETRAWIYMKQSPGGFEGMTDERINQVLGRFSDSERQNILDAWSDPDSAMQIDDDLKTGDINQVLGEEVVRAASHAKARADGVEYRGETTKDRWQGTWDQMNIEQNADRHDRTSSEIMDVEDFVALLPEVAATADYVSKMRDPEFRSSASPGEIHDLVSFAKALSNDINASKSFFDHLRASGVDPAPLEDVLREQLDKYGLGQLMSMDSYPPWEMRQEADQALTEYRTKRDSGDPAIAEGINVVNHIGASMANSNSAGAHQTYAAIVEGMLYQNRKNYGNTTADQRLSNAVRQLAANDRFGFMTDVLNQLSVDEAVREGDAAAISDLTGGKQALVSWDADTTLSPDLVSDDRAGQDDHHTATGDRKFAEGMAQMTPNVSAALNSMFAAYGGGIHRTRSDITEANIAAAEQWRSDANSWNRPGSDNRTPEQTTGVYTSPSNSLVIADKTFQYSSFTNVVTHELGHAMDSMLGNLGGSGGSYGAYFSLGDAKFNEMRNKMLEIASYGDNPEESMMFWYFRNQDEGSRDHNGASGTVETWAETYSAYAAMRAELERAIGGEGFPDEPAFRRSVYEEGGRILLNGDLTRARGAGINAGKMREKWADAGELMYEFFDDFENNRLPELMKNPTVVKKRTSSAPNAVATALGAPPPASDQRIPNAVQTARASGHRYNGTPLNMAQIKPGDQNYDAVIDAMKERNPGFTGPSPQNLGVWYNQDWASAEDGTLLMKVIMPGNDDPTNIYDYKHSKKSNAQKFQREQAVHKVHKPLREKSLNEAMDDPIAAMVATMIDSGMRVDDAKGKNRTKSVKRKKVEQVIGASSLMPKHLTFNENGSARIDFMGKSGVDNRYTVKDPRLVAALKKWSEGKGPNDFIFGDTNADQSIAYLRDATGIVDMINHDLRTYMANAVVFQWLQGLPGFKKTSGKTAKQMRDDPNPARPKKGMSAEEFEKFKVKGWQQAAAQLNDGWTTVRDNYVSPYVWYSLEHDLDLPHSWDELITFTGVPEHPGPTNVPAPPTNVPGGPTNVPGGPTNVPVEGGPRPEPVAAAAAATPSEDEAIESAEPTTPVDFSDAAYRDLDNFYGSVEWAGLDPATPPPAPMFTESLPPGDEVE